MPGMTLALPLNQNLKNKNKMNNIDVLHPAIGSNGFVTKFDESKKRKKLKVKTATKVKIAVILTLLFSLYLNWYLLKTNYTINCYAEFDGIKQTQWGSLGHFESQNTCNQLIEDRISANLSK